jgi:threonine aldolase
MQAHPLSISALIVWTLSGATPPKHADAAVVARGLPATPGVEVRVDRPTNALIFVADPKALNALASLKARVRTLDR